jgi:hypothetical protein
MSKVKATDHLGNEFSSVMAMCKHYGVRRQLYYKRMLLGWTQKMALTTPVIPPSVNLHTAREKSYTYQFAGGTVTVREHLRN